ncbi:RNA degradosome polyphosphate kinase, partial [Streptococcus pyogenes]
LGSADLMRRNLLNRVETVVPILDVRLQKRVLRILATDLQNTTGAWKLMPDHTYIQRQPSKENEEFDSQTSYMQDSFGL